MPRALARVARGCSKSLRLNSQLRRGYVRISGAFQSLPVSDVAAIMEAKRNRLPDTGR